MSSPLALVISSELQVQSSQVDHLTRIHDSFVLVSMDPFNNPRSKKKGSKKGERNRVLVPPSNLCVVEGAAENHRDTFSNGKSAVSISNLSALDHAMILRPPDATRAQLDLVVLKHALRTGTYFDVKFYLPSQRDVQGFIRQYEPIWANSLMLRAKCDHFERCKWRQMFFY